MPRKKPFSGKQKKEQLKAKKNRKRGAQNSQGRREPKAKKSFFDEDDPLSNIDVICPLAANLGKKEQKRRSKKGNAPIYSVFKKDSKAVVKKLKAAAMQPYIPNQSKRFDSEGFKFAKIEVPLPRRPTWDCDKTAVQFQAAEENYFKSYIGDLIDKYGIDRLNKFELNIDVWRQFWRLTEMVDLLAIVCDMRCPPFHLPKGLLSYAKDAGRDILIVLTKPDTVPKPEVVERYIETAYPGIPSVTVCNRPAGKGESRPAPIGLDKLMKAMRPKKSTETDCSKAMENLKVQDEKEETKSEKRNDSAIFRVGFIGQPNGGKSSIINALLGEIKTAVSSTPGKTKHLQTLFLSETLEVIDCPGLIFPQVDMPFALQVILGVYPVAQVQEPYSVMQYVCERFNLVDRLRLVPYGEKPNWKDPDYDWSAFEVCESYSVKRGYMSKKGGVDVYRGANELLRKVTVGQLDFYCEF